MKQAGRDSNRTTRTGFVAEDLPDPLSQVYRYWNSLETDGDVPRRDAFDPIAIGRMLDHVILVGVQDEPLEFHFRVIGDYVNSRLKEPCMHRALSQLPGKGPGTEIWSLYERCYRERIALFDQLNYVGPVRGIKQSFEIYMPLSDDKGDVTNIVVCLTFDQDGAIRGI